MKRCHQQSDTSFNRSGMVLVLVLVVVMMLSFAVYSFSNMMLTEYAATTTGLTHLQRRELAASGIEIAAMSLQQRNETVNRSSAGISLRKPIPLQIADGRKGIISILRELPGSHQAPHFGLSDESAKLNLNALPLELSRRPEARKRLLAIPGMMIQTADAILDWMDPDDEPSEYGAETSFYTAQPLPVRPRQGPFQHLDELLLVRGITAELLFGEDLNANGILDPEEDDGEAHLPRDNKDGILQRGWSQYLTLVSGESTALPGGRQKINLNQPVLAVLFDELEPVLGQEAAVYIVAWRMRGATFADDVRPDEGDDQERRRLERLESARKRLAAQLGNTTRTRPGLTSDQTQRGGLRLSDGSMKFKSLLDLFGGHVRVSREGRDILLQSPWSSDPVSLRRMLPLFERMLTTAEGDALPGRININEATAPVLKSIPRLKESAVHAIVSIQKSIDQAPAASDEFDSVAWLLSRGLVSKAELRAIGPYITTGGDVRGGFSIGQMTGHQPVAITRFLLDCTGHKYRLLQCHDLEIMPASAIGIPTSANSTFGYK